MEDASRRTFDCFCYFNEDMLLELRLETLWDHVDYFVIAESMFTQTGRPKPLNFKIENFRKYESKIRYLAIDHLPEGPLDFWRNENYQRNCLARGLFDARPDDLIIVSDLDEIPRPQAIAAYDAHTYKRADLEQYAYAYFLNNMRFSGNDPALWFGSKITTFKHLEDFFRNVNSVRSYKSSGPLRRFKRAWFRRFHVQIIKDAGWHFTWVLSPEDMVIKMQSVAETHFYDDHHKRLEYIKDTIESGRDLLDPQTRYLLQSVTEPAFPAFLVGHKEKYCRWLR
jgi:beta-1,4-mannosyl-glycoprotein beta-1,4-N-acetylglucosaminyltransferase